MTPPEPPVPMDEDELEPFYRLDANGALTWTEEGLRTYRRRFARFGIRIEAIETFEDYRTAMRLSAGVFVEDTLEQLAERAKGQPWRELLEAAFLGDAAALERAKHRYGRRRQLTLISGSSASTAPRRS